MIKLAPRTAIVGAIAILGVAVSGCASHRFVRDNVQVVNERVDGVDSHLTQVEGTAGEALARANWPKANSCTKSFCRTTR